MVKYENIFKNLENTNLNEEEREFLKELLNKQKNIDVELNDRTINPFDFEYNKVIMEIIMENLKDEDKFNNIKKKYDNNELTLRQAYNKVLEVADDNKLSNAMSSLSKDRTGTGTWKKPGAFMEFDLANGFPLITTKKVPFKSVLNELMWFVNGDTNIKGLLERKCKIWNKDAFRNYVDKNDLWEEYPRNSEKFDKAAYNWFTEQILSDDEFAKKWGDLGPVYGAQWRNFGGHQGLKGVDQFANLIKTLKENPSDRRMLVFAYNPQEKHMQTLPACHIFFQAIVKNDKLNLSMYMRSNDMFLGSPFNIASYAILLHILAKETNFEVGKLSIKIGDSHIYANHIDQIQEQLSRSSFAPPEIEVADGISFEDHSVDTIKLLNYESHDRIYGAMST